MVIVGLTALVMLLFFILMNFSNIQNEVMQMYPESQRCGSIKSIFVNKQTNELDTAKYAEFAEMDKNPTL